MSNVRYPVYAGFGSKSSGGNPKEVASVENVRYAVPTNYTSGDEFPTLGEAVVAAEQQAREGTNALYREGSAESWKHYRVHIDRRGTIVRTDGSKVDMVLDRIEVFLP
jgi:hypothetical protein